MFECVKNNCVLVRAVLAAFCAGHGGVYVVKMAFGSVSANLTHYNLSSNISLTRNDSLTGRNDSALSLQSAVLQLLYLDRPQNYSLMVFSTLVLAVSAVVGTLGNFLVNRFNSSNQIGQVHTVAL